MNRLWPAPIPFHVVFKALPPFKLMISLFCCELQTTTLTFISDHQVQGQRLAPATMSLEIAACCSRTLTGEPLKRAKRPQVASIKSGQVVKPMAGLRGTYYHEKRSKIVCLSEPYSMHVGNGVHHALDQHLQMCSLPKPLSILATASKRVECFIDHVSSDIKVSSGSAPYSYIHLSGNVRRGVELPYNLTKRIRMLSQYSPSTLLSILAPSYVHHAAICCASVHVHSDMHISGYLAHPAIVDSSLHIGAVVATQNIGSFLASTYIPIALDAFNVYGPVQPAHRMNAHAEVNAGKHLLSAVSSYHVRQIGDTTPCGFQLMDLHARAVQLQQSLGKYVARPSMLVNYTYAIQWQCSSSTSSYILKKSFLPSDLRHIWLDKQGNRIFGKTTYSARSATASLLSDIALIQSVITLAGPTQHINLMGPASPHHNNIVPLERPSLSFHNLSCRGDNSTISTSACLGAMKVTASEHPNNVWGSVMASHYNNELPKVPKGVDAFGQIISGRATQEPLLLVTLQQPERIATECKEVGGKIIISGGLNGVSLNTERD